MNGCIVRCTARPPSRSTPPRRNFLALEPVRTKCGGDGSSRMAWTTVRSSGTRWISSITTVPFPGEPASRSRRRSGRALRLRCSAGSSRSRYRASGSRSRSQVDLPVPRGPSRKQLRFGIWRNRPTNSIMGRKVETGIPIFSPIAGADQWHVRRKSSRGRGSGKDGRPALLGYLVRSSPRSLDALCGVYDGSPASVRNGASIAMS